MEYSSDKDVLAVEDNAELRDLICEALRDGGFRVRAAANGAEALETLRSGPAPALLLIDLMMPVMDGWTLHEHLRSDPRTAAIPVVVMTAFDACVAPVPGAAMLRKPFGVDDLIRAVEAHL